MFWSFKKKKPTTIEVIEAIFDQVFTPEELESMDYKDEWIKKLGETRIRERMIIISKHLRPKYSVEKSVRLTRKFVEPHRKHLLKSRPCIWFFLKRKIFKEI